MYPIQSIVRQFTAALCLVLVASAQAQPKPADLAAIPVEELTPEQAVELFKTLPAPTLEEMNGEFAGEMLSFPTLYTSIFWTIASNNPIYPGVWQGKSFQQTGPNEGRGYNTVERWFTQKVDIWPMVTRIGPSYFDGKPSFQLVYRAFDHYAGDIHMLDEVRRLPDGRYLGIGRTGTTTEERRLAMPFLLSERIGDYRQDIGEPREGFDMAAELELLEFPPEAYRDTTE
ncbi:MAG: hypothetical protein KDI05_16845 [Halieaceae bacterium]|nr:hypothetical protein [Halieaceae bacterium]